ncbi:hypothetical protein RB213_001119 [Colletotrichum asianum]
MAMLDSLHAQRRVPNRPRRGREAAKKVGYHRLILDQEALNTMTRAWSTFLDDHYRGKPPPRMATRQPPRRSAREDIRRRCSSSYPTSSNPPIDPCKTSEQISLLMPTSRAPGSIGGGGGSQEQGTCLGR